MKKLVTHNGKFHADDVLAFAILSKYLKMNGEDFEIIRSRDSQIIESADIVFDVGDSYSVEKNRFDHHQTGRAGSRENGIPYAACGLIWKHFGPAICPDHEVWETVDVSLVQGIDAGDNGVSTETPLFPGVGSFTIGSVIDCFMPENEDAALVEFDAGFTKASDFMEFVLSKIITNAQRRVRNKKEITSVYENSTDKEIIICEKYIPGVKKLLSAFPEPIFAIYPDQNNNWRVEGVRINKDDFPIRKDLPKAWAGLRDHDLQNVSGVLDATFCHPGLFTAGAVSKSGALELAKKTLLM